MPVERQWAADHCQSGTEQHVHRVSVNECDCVFAAERCRVFLYTLDVYVCVCVGL